MKKEKLFPAPCLQWFWKERLSNRIIILFSLGHSKQKIKFGGVNLVLFQGLIGCIKDWLKLGNTTSCTPKAFYKINDELY